MKYFSLVLCLLFLVALIPPVAATEHPTAILPYGNDFYNGRYVVHTRDTSSYHNLKAKVYSPLKGTLIPKKHYTLVFECWKGAYKDNGDEILSNRLYTESDELFFDNEAEVNPAKWHEQGLPIGNYYIKIIFKGFKGFLGINTFSSSTITIPFSLIP